LRLRPDAIAADAYRRRIAAQRNRFIAKLTGRPPICGTAAESLSTVMGRADDGTFYQRMLDRQCRSSWKSVLFSRNFEKQQSNCTTLNILI
jgi:hypothetical protein